MVQSGEADWVQLIEACFTIQYGIYFWQASLDHFC